MHKILKWGHRAVTGFDKDGNAVIETVDPSAVMLDGIENGDLGARALEQRRVNAQALRSRFRDLGNQSPTDPGTAAGDLAKAAAKPGIRYQGRRAPPVDLEGDVDATG